MDGCDGSCDIGAPIGGTIGDADSKMGDDGSKGGPPPPPGIGNTTDFATGRNAGEPVNNEMRGHSINPSSSFSEGSSLNRVFFHARNYTMIK